MVMTIEIGYLLNFKATTNLQLVR